MKTYNFTLKDKSKVKISFSPNLDNQFTQYRGRKPVGGVFLMDCGIVYTMPFIMRYCFEADVNLREREFIRDLPPDELPEMARFNAEFLFRRPLKRDIGVVRNVEGNMSLHSSPDEFDGSITFQPGDVAELVEGILRVMDYGGVKGGHERCCQTIQYYHKCLDNGFF